MWQGYYEQKTCTFCQWVVVGADIPMTEAALLKMGAEAIYGYRVTDVQAYRKRVWISYRVGNRRDSADQNEGR